MAEQSTEMKQLQKPGDQVTGTSLTSFDDAAESAFHRVIGDPHNQGARAAEVERMWITAGGDVGLTHYHVELRVLGNEHVDDAPSVEGAADLEPVSTAPADK